ncbi:MarR family winged helix-turn-helix transcriptional regulator [Arthrobacter sp. ERGS1:01]|uniref:MarR family winged helix-turn-helix transcriptional regulator n=1 Tax=Arthrobacter sp. ERGS1:01 TaxID=1704044 RepID=UPI000A791C63|nr:MarR family winged helix-turn-helix transcriptional regulator [Arthrobacter sp. ERGS1:01]
MEKIREFRGEPDPAVAAVRALVRVSRLLERSLGELSLPHYRVLAAVSAGDEIASRVATRLALGRPAVSAAVASLCERGFLDRVDVAADQRAAGLRLTENGWAALSRADAAMAAELRSVTARTEQPAQLLDTLGWLNEAVSARYAEQRDARAAVVPGTAPTGTPGPSAEGSAPA